MIWYLTLNWFESCDLILNCETIWFGLWIDRNWLWFDLNVMIWYLTLNWLKLTLNWLELTVNWSEYYNLISDFELQIDLVLTFMSFEWCDLILNCETIRFGLWIDWNWLLCDLNGVIWYLTFNWLWFECCDLMLNCQLIGIDYELIWMLWFVIELWIDIELWIGFNWLWFELTLVWIVTSKFFFDRSHRSRMTYK